MRILGKVAWVGSDKYDHSIGRVTPLLDTTETPWRQVKPEEFPTQGLAFWFGPLPEAHAESLVYFKPEENPAGQKDKFRVIQAELAEEVLDLRPVGSIEQARTALLAGIRRPGIPGGRVFLWCKDDVLVGPVRLVVTGGALTLEKTMARHRIPYSKAKASEIMELIDGRAIRFVALSSPDQPQGFVDWDDDHLVVRRALQFALAQDKPQGEKVVLALSAIKEAAERIAQASDGADLALEQMRLARARALVSNLEINSGNARALVEILRRHPEVIKELEVVARSESAKVRAECEELLKNERAELEALKNERDRVEAELSKAQNSLSELKLNQEREIHEVEKATAERLQEIMRRPAALLAEAAILKHVLSGVTPEGRRTAPSAVPPRDIRPWTRGQSVVTDLTDFRKCLGSSLKQRGLPPSLLQALHAAFSARLSPIIAGPRALLAAEAYAQVVAGGRITVVHASASLVEPSDVFGRRDAGTGKFVPHPAGLVDVIAAARQSNGLRVVVLDGINRGPTESYLLPLLRLAMGRGQPLPLFSPVAMDEADPYRGESLIEWPSNLLLCTTLVEGPTTLPVAPDVWFDGVLVQTDGTEPSPPTTTAEQQESSEVLPGSDLFQPPSGGDDLSAPLFEALPEFRSVQETAARFARYLRRFSTAAASVRMEVFRASIVPQLVRVQSDERRNQIAKQLATVLSTQENAVLELVELAKGRIA